ncbi:hypothetical protein F5Y03DRAFT_4362 [Xylaria venustula]|nr:hypothetical protein F5Y03DRAFT_4362 [Xylaria venustula]
MHECENRWWRCENEQCLSSTVFVAYLDKGAQTVSIWTRHRPGFSTRSVAPCLLVFSFIIKALCRRWRSYRSVVLPMTAIISMITGFLLLFPHSVVCKRELVMSRNEMGKIYSKKI